MSWYNPLTWGQTADTSPLTGEQATANQTAQTLAAQRAAFGGDPTNNPNTTADRSQQEQAIQQLQGAANGTAPSAADLQLKQQADANNAAAFGAAAALKGRTPGASFTTAARQNASNQLQTNATAAAQRAAEMAQARSALSGAVATQQQQDQAQSALKTNYATNLLQGQLSSQGQGITAAGDIVGANVSNAQTQNAFTGGLLGGGAGVGEAALMASDKRVKKDVRKEDLDDTFKALGGAKTFEYKDPTEDGAAPGERVGIMAQDLQKTPLGKSVVVDGKPLKVDIGNALGMAMGQLASLTERIRDLETKKG